MQGLEERGGGGRYPADGQVQDRGRPQAAWEAGAKKGGV